MARFYGRIGYGNSVDDGTNTGIFVDEITERYYYGDVQRISSNQLPGENLTPDLSVSNTIISIVADAYAENNFSAIHYVEWSGAFWTVTNVIVQRPRLLLTLGEVYNGPTAESTPTP